MDSTVKKYRVLVADGGRHRQPTGYGKNARSLILGLAARPDFEVAVTPTPRNFEIEPELAEPFVDIATATNPAKFDCALQIGQPLSCRPFPIPTLMFTNMDVSGFPESWLEKLQHVDGMLAPNRDNFALFKRHFNKVFLTQQGVPEQLFKPVPHWRQEGPDKFAFIFVGTYSFRKGVDILLEAFIKEFSPIEAHLHLHIPGEQSDRAANAILKIMARLGRVSSITLSSDTLTERWMARRYNSYDCFVTATRGEGWGLPIVEAMLTGLPVVVPNSTGIKDYVNSEVGVPVPVTVKAIDDITDDFGQNFKATYGGNGITYEEVSVDDLRRAMRWVFQNQQAAKQLGVAAREHILRNHSEKRFVDATAAAIVELVESGRVQVQPTNV